MQLHKADILLVHRDGLISVGIEVVSRSPWCHAAFVADVDKMLLIEAQGFREVGYEPLDHYKGQSVVLRVPDLTDVQADGIVKYGLDHFGVKYDYDAILQEFDRYELGVQMKPEHGLFICSSLVAAAYKSVGVTLSDIVIPSPDDLWKSPKVQIIGRY